MLQMLCADFGVSADRDCEGETETELGQAQVDPRSADTVPLLLVPLEQVRAPK